VRKEVSSLSAKFISAIFGSFIFLPFARRLNRAVTYAVHKFTLAASLVPSWHKRIQRKLSWTNIAHSRTHLSAAWAEAKKYISELEVIRSNRR
jgi:hypothetical protein